MAKSADMGSLPSSKHQRNQLRQADSYDEWVFFLDPAKRSSTTLSEKPRKRKRLLRASKRLAVSLPLEVVDLTLPWERSAESVWVEKVAERRSTALTISGTKADLSKLGKQK